MSFVLIHSLIFVSCTRWHNATRTIMKIKRRILCWTFFVFLSSDYATVCQVLAITLWSLSLLNRVDITSHTGLLPPSSPSSSLRRCAAEAVVIVVSPAPIRLNGSLRRRTRWAGPTYGTRHLGSVIWSDGRATSELCTTERLHRTAT